MNIKILFFFPFLFPRIRERNFHRKDNALHYTLLNLNPNVKPARLYHFSCCPKYFHRIFTLFLLVHRLIFLIFVYTVEIEIRNYNPCQRIIEFISASTFISLGVIETSVNFQRYHRQSTKFVFSTLNLLHDWVFPSSKVIRDVYSVCRSPQLDPRIFSLLKCVNTYTTITWFEQVLCQVLW